MRLLLVLVTAICAGIVALTARVDVTYAQFHCMRIHAVMAEYNGDPAVQFVELRMNTGGQNVVVGKTIEFYSAGGTLMATFTFPANVMNASTGDSVLIGTPKFNQLTGGGDADFLFDGNTTGTDPLTPIQAAGGKVKFAPGFDNCDPDGVAGPGEVDSLAYGAVTGLATPDFTPTPAAALPVSGNRQALRLNNLSFAPSNNSTEYALAAASISAYSVGVGNLATDFTTPRNNSRMVLDMALSVGGVAEDPAAASLPVAEASDSSGITAPYFGGAVAALLILAAAGSWSVYRRRRAR